MIHISIAEKDFKAVCHRIPGRRIKEDTAVYNEIFGACIHDKKDMVFVIYDNRENINEIENGDECRIFGLDRHKQLLLSGDSFPGRAAGCAVYPPIRQAEKQARSPGGGTICSIRRLFSPDYEQGMFGITKNFFADDTVKGKDGLIRFAVGFFDGSTTDIWLKVSGEKVTSKKSLEKKPAVPAVKVKAGKKKALVLKNVADGAAVTYQTENKKIAAVTKKGVIKGMKAGKTKVKVMVTQYGRTDTVTGSVEVSK